MVASYVFEEDDLHKNNFGVDGSGQVRRFDLDMSFFATTYAQTRGDRSGRLANTMNSWPVTTRDIINFPVLKDAEPWFWPTKTHSFLSHKLLSGRKRFTKGDVKLFSGLKENEAFKQEKYRCFLKTLLIPERCFSEKFKSHIPASNEERGALRNEFISHLNERRRMLYDALMAIPDFHHAVTEENLNAIVHELATELGITNEQEKGFLRSEMQQTFHSIKEEIENRQALLGTIDNDMLKDYLIKHAPTSTKSLTKEKIQEINKLIEKNPNIFSFRKKIKKELGYKLPLEECIKIKKDIKKRALLKRKQQTQKNKPKKYRRWLFLKTGKTNPRKSSTAPHEEEKPKARTP